MFDCNTRTLSAIELKSTQGTLTFWRKDFEEENPNQKYQIKKNQICGLQKWSKYLMNCGFIINFRNENNDTYFIYIDEFLNYTNHLNKKSINIEDVKNMNPIKIENDKLRTNYRYNIDQFLENIHL